MFYFTRFIGILLTSNQQEFLIFNNRLSQGKSVWTVGIEEARRVGLAREQPPIESVEIINKCHLLVSFNLTVWLFYFW